jgi:hypothetical protein
VLTRKLEESSHVLDAQAISNMLYGMHRMGNYAGSGVSRLTEVLAERIQGSACVFDGQACGNAMYGLQSMSNDDEGCNRLIEAITDKISGCTDILSAQECGNALLGLKGMSSGSVEMRRLIKSLTDKVESCVQFDNQAIGNALYGMQSLDSGEEAVVNLLHILHKRLETCADELTLQHIASSLYGLQGMQFTVPVVEGIYSHIFRAMEIWLSSPDLTNFEEEHLHALSQSLAFMSAGRKIDIPSSYQLRISKARGMLREHFVKHTFSTDDSSFRSKAEEKTADRIALLLARSNKQVLMTTNEMLDGFEADVVLRESGDRARTLNIEIDGPTHAFHSSRRFCTLRDNYLTQQGIIVRRVALGSHGISALGDTLDSIVTSFLLS